MSHTGGGSTTERILLVQPQPPGTEGLRRKLGAGPWQVFRASDPVEALQAVRSQRVDLVLLHLPVSDSADMDLPNVLRGVSPCAYLPVLIVTARAAGPLGCRFLDSGADAIVSETASAGRLASRIRALLRVRRTYQRLEESRRRLHRAVRRHRRMLHRLRRDNAGLRHLAATDPLTELRNLRSFEEALDHQFKVARRYNRPLSLLLLDVDHFKGVNDTHGHPAGDAVLKRLADVLRGCVRESDLAARTGGDEMAILLPDAGRQQARAMAERVRREVRRRPLLGRDGPIRPTLSIGLATWPADACITSPAELVHAADVALLRAKADRDRIEAFADNAHRTAKKGSLVHSLTG